MKLIAPLVCCAAAAHAQPASFEGIGDLPGQPFESAALGVSADGQVVVGTSVASSPYVAVRWTSATGIQSLEATPSGTQGSYARAASADGSAIVGYSYGGSFSNAFRWTAATGMVQIGDLPGGSVSSQAFGVSADGNTVVGHSDAGLINYTAFRWTPQAGMHTFLPIMTNTSATAISADGSTIVGISSSWGYRWSAQAGMQIIEVQAYPYAASSDGMIIAGTFQPCGAFRWSPATGIECLGKLPASQYAQANAISADGQTLVGTSYSPPPTQEPHRAFIWDETGGIRNLRDVLQDVHGLNLAGWKLTEANGISADGKTIVGAGVNPCFQKEGWVARLGAQPACYADCTLSGGLSIADFGCFQSRFVAQDRYADCNGDCQFTIADFGCFQSKFVAGCP